VKDERTGEITELHCTFDPETRSGPPPDGRKVEGVIHWVSAKHSVSAEVRLYDRLFRVPDPGSISDDYLDYLNPDSIKVLPNCCVEASLKYAAPGNRYQFERIGYFCLDTKDSAPGKPVFNRIVSLRDTWSKIAGPKQGPQ